MSTFRHVHKPKLIVIDRDLNGKLDLNGNATILHITGDIEQSIAYLEKTQEISLAEPVINEVLISLYIEGNFWEKAASKIEHLLSERNEPD